MLSLLRLLAVVVVFLGLPWWSIISMPGSNDAETPDDDKQPRTFKDIRHDLEIKGINLPTEGWLQIEAAVKDHLNYNYELALIRYNLLTSVPRTLGGHTNLVEESQSLKYNLQLAKQKLPRKP